MRKSKNSSTFIRILYTQQKILLLAAFVSLVAFASLFLYRNQTLFESRNADQANAAVKNCPSNVSGACTAWQPLEISFVGPNVSATGNPNPFTDYKLQVDLVGPGGQRYSVPGFYDGNGSVAVPNPGDNPQPGNPTPVPTSGGQPQPGGGTGAFIEQGGQVSIEGENFHSQSLTTKRSWYVTSTSQQPGITPDADPSHANGASGNAYIEILPDTRQGHSDPLVTGESFSDTPGVAAVVSYKVRFNQAGRYYVKVRAYSTGSEDNGVHVGINGNWPSSGQRMQWCAKDAWTWDGIQRTSAQHCGDPNARTYIDVPSAGEHTISFSMREDGFEMDKFVLSTNPTFLPSGTGPAESSRQQAWNLFGVKEAHAQSTQSGGIWKIRFSPDQGGVWTYQASFRTGSNVAVDLNTNAGSPTSFNGQTGSFSVADPDRSAPGYWAKGRLQHVGKHYMQFLDGSYWLKGGIDSPENWLGYTGFVNTPGRMNFSAHGGINGAVDYLSSLGTNSLYFLLMNIGGDGKDSFPFMSSINTSGSSSNNNTRYDVEKLRQWNNFFNYMQQKGMVMHFVLGEGESNNKNELDSGKLGNERKLFYREMIARFGHHNAYQWNISEEYDGGGGFNLGSSEVRAMAQYIKDVSPYKNVAITVHNAADPSTTFTPFLGSSSPFNMMSIQKPSCPGATDCAGMVNEWRTRSAQAGKPVVVGMDEIATITTSNADHLRKNALWPIYFAGGQVEWYATGAEDQSLQDFRKYEAIYRYTGYARKFIEENLPFWDMSMNNSLLSNATGRVFAQNGVAYGVYLPSGGSPRLNLSGASGTFNVRWYNPRSGQYANSLTVNGGSTVSLGSAPDSNDWAIAVIKPGAVQSPAPVPQTPAPVPQTPVPVPTSGGGTGGGNTISGLPRLKTIGNRLVTAHNNQDIVLRGMNVCGLEFDKNQIRDKYRLANGQSGLFTDLRNQWNVNVVRVTLAQDWLLNDSTYFNNVTQLIDDANRKGIYLVLDNQWERGGTYSILQRPTLGTSGNTTEAFWRKVAQNWGGKTNLIYDIINEPHDASQADVASRMQAVINSVNQIQGEAVFMVSEPNWSHEIRYHITNPLNAGRSNGVIYSVHQYSDYDPATTSEMNFNFGDASRTLPMFFGEFDLGEKVDRDYQRKLITYAESVGVDGWAGWAIGCKHHNSSDHTPNLSSYPGFAPVKWIVDYMKANNRHPGQVVGGPNPTNAPVTTPVPTDLPSQPTNSPANPTQSPILQPPISPEDGTGSLTGIVNGQSVSGRIYVQYNPRTSVRYVEFYIDSSRINTEYTGPYYLGGNSGSTIYGYDVSRLSSGTHTLRARVFDSNNRLVDEPSLQFMVGTSGGNPSPTNAPAPTNPPSQPTNPPASSGNLVSSDSRVRFIQDRSYSNNRAYIRVEVNGVSVNRIVFFVDGQQKNIEYTAPYFLGGDASGNPYGYYTTNQDINITARVYTTSGSYFDAKTTYAR